MLINEISRKEREEACSNHYIGMMQNSNLERKKKKNFHNVRSKNIQSFPSTFDRVDTPPKNCRPKFLFPSPISLPPRDTTIFRICVCVCALWPRACPWVTHYFRLAVLILPLPLLPPTHRGRSRNTHENTENAIARLESRYNPPPPPPPPPLQPPDRHRTALSDFTWPAYNNFSNPPPHPHETGINT